MAFVLNIASRLGVVAASSSSVDWTSGVDALLSNYGWSFNPNDSPVTFRHVANGTSGYALPEAPGEAYAYNDYAIQLYGETLQRVFGGSNSPASSSLQTAAASRIGTPLQLEGGSGSLFTSRNGLGQNIYVNDYARIGWWWINQGNWNGQQLIHSSWFTDYWGQYGCPVGLPHTTGSGTADDYLGVDSYGGPVQELALDAVMPGRYGWNLWVNGVSGSGTPWPDLPADTYCVSGHGGQESVIVIPSLNIVASGFGDFGNPGVPAATDTIFNDRTKLLVDAVTGAGSVSATFPGATWTDITDAQAGMDTSAIDTYINAVNLDTNLGYGILVRYGYQVRIWGDIGEPVEWSSGGKPMLSIMLAFAIEEGLV